MRERNKCSLWYGSNGGRERERERERGVRAGDYIQDDDVLQSREAKKRNTGLKRSRI
jgi:hypothetical protein